MRAAFERDDDAVESIFDAATAFTHPRRVEIFRLAQKRPGTIEELHVATAISIPALRRHLRKLEARDFLKHRYDRYYVVSQSDVFRRHLVRLAMAE